MVFQIVRWREGDDPPRLNRNLDSCLGIAACPLAFLSDHEIPESGELHVLSSLQSIADLGEYLLG
jgi:hypothetical protein